jgi:Zn-dependent protease
MFSGFPLLGWAKPVPVNMHYLRHPRRDFAVVAAAGPISNLILAVAGSVSLGVLAGIGEVPRSDSMVLIYTTLLVFVQMNVLLAVFNMLPVPPLDGGNVLMGVVPEPVARAIDSLRPWGFLILYALLFTGVLGTIIRPINRIVLGLLP